MSSPSIDFNVTIAQNSGSSYVANNEPTTLAGLGSTPGGWEAAVDAVLEGVGNWINGKIDDSGMPDAMKDGARAFVDSTVDGLSYGADSGDVSDAMSIMMNVLDNMAEEANEEFSRSSSGAKEGKGGQNWLVLMATVLAENAADHLAKSLEYADKIGGIGDLEGVDLEKHVGDGFIAGDGEGAQQQARATTVLQAKMQAETQLFKMVFEAASTLTKTVGEGFSTMARKQ